MGNILEYLEDQNENKEGTWGGGEGGKMRGRAVERPRHH